MRRITRSRVELKPGFFLFLGLLNVKDMFLTKRVGTFFNMKHLSSICHAFVTSKLDYCNALFYGLPKYQLQRLLYVQNTAARVVLQMSRFQHITPVLCELGRYLVSLFLLFQLFLNKV